MFLSSKEVWKLLNLMNLRSCIYFNEKRLLNATKLRCVLQRFTASVLHKGRSQNCIKDVLMDLEKCNFLDFKDAKTKFDVRENFSV